MRPAVCAGIDKFLLFSSLKAVRGIPLQENRAKNLEAITPITGNDTNFVGLDYDAADDYIYYSDVKNDVIWRVHFNGTGAAVCSLVVYF